MNTIHWLVGDSNQVHPSSSYTTVAAVRWFLAFVADKFNCILNYFVEQVRMEDTFLTYFYCNNFHTAQLAKALRRVIRPEELLCVIVVDVAG